MPDIHFECPKCNQPIDAPEELAAQLVNCPTCKELIEVPVRSRQVEPVKPPEPSVPPPATRPPVVQTPDLVSMTPLALLFIGAMMGYIVSYFAQPSLFREIISLGDYIGHIQQALMPSGAPGLLTDSICVTAWEGVVMGIVVMSGLILYKRHISL